MKTNKRDITPKLTKATAAGPSTPSNATTTSNDVGGFKTPLAPNRHYRYTSTAATATIVSASTATATIEMVDTKEEIENNVNDGGGGGGVDDSGPSQQITIIKSQIVNEQSADTHAEIIGQPSQLVHFFIFCFIYENIFFFWVSFASNKVACVF